MARVRWWHLGIFGTLLAVAVILGLTGYDKTAPDNTLYSIAGVGLCVAAFLFMVIYTVLGLRPGRAGWWTNLTGFSLMVVVGAIFLKNLVETWAVLFHNGLVNTPLSAWLFVAGAWFMFLALVSLCLLWVWNRNAHGPVAPPEEPAEPH